VNNEGAPLWLVAIVVAVAIAASLHVILRKRDVRAAIGWVGLIWLVPGVGALLYALLGVNRIKRRAIELHGERRRVMSASAEHVATMWMLGQHHPNLGGLARLGEQLTNRPLLGGNLIEPLIDGDQAYPAMLAAIDAATSSVSLSTFIFGDDRVGKRFVDALSRAVARGVHVRVLIDGVGLRYTRPPVHRSLRRANVPTALFLPTIAQAGLAFFNLRSHRKVLVVDGRVAFSGGMNIAERHFIAEATHPHRDMHFRIEGPVVRQLQDAFVEDWASMTNELLDGQRWYPDLIARGPTSARVITDGPDADDGSIHNMLMGALSSARESVRILTPYFLPDASMIAALGVTALRGVRVDIVLPARGNVPFAQWAATAQLWQVLRPGCRVWMTPPPFDHSKLFVIDRAWSLIGSTNWDARSLRLNFELDIECHDVALAGRLDDLIEQRLAASRPYTLVDADSRPFLVRVRDGVARLFSPYL
jgi:cardiolipin synthase